MKKVLIALLFVLLALCLVSCGGNDPKNPASGSGSGNGSGSGSGSGGGGGSAFGGGVDDITWNETAKVLSINFKDRTWVSLSVATNYVTIALTTGDGSTLDCDRVMIQGAATAFSDPLRYDDGVSFTGAKDEGYLPETANNWAVDFTKGANEDVVFSFVIPKEKTAKVLAAM